MGIMAIFNPLITLYHGIIFRAKFTWHSRKKKKKRDSVKNFLMSKLTDKGMSERTIKKLIDNYCNFGEIIFDRKILKGFLQLDKTLLQQESKVKSRIES